ncbi:hypothetical protein D7Y13_38990 [Corallococcus praedator]|uniref:Uncharacterized protein n=1 Tax=Corallococcus praedator TaxID=2316724 RepID=A0ABX9Q4U8_9BACT|nr:hypothetical protein D7X75_39760 [Corallococcus sp. CA031C]RKH91197.1 hypothetical protein D7Y13_38990 [Corallococcus praedator]
MRAGSAFVNKDVMQRPDLCGASTDALREVGAATPHKTTRERTRSSGVNGAGRPQWMKEPCHVQAADRFARPATVPSSSCEGRCSAVRSCRQHYAGLQGLRFDGADASAQRNDQHRISYLLAGSADRAGWGRAREEAARRPRSRCGAAACLTARAAAPGGAQPR